MTDTGQLYVLCDTNVAARDAHLFRKKGGPELIAMLRATHTKLLVPEVLSREYVSQFMKAGDETIQKAERELDKLESMAGYSMKPFLPPKGFGESQAHKTMATLEDVIHLVPLTDELKLAACDRSMNDRPPSSKSDHGLKDCMIWDSLLTLPVGSEVLLLSRDAVAFFDAKGGLVAELAREAESKGIKVTAFKPEKEPSLMPVVQALKARFTDIEGLVVDVAPIVDHPMLRPVPDVMNVEPMVTTENAGYLHQTRTVAPEEIEAELVATLRPLLSADAMALGFVTAMKSTDKRSIVDMMERSGVPKNVSNNALERLVLADLIKDTGNHYLAKETPLARHAVAQIEDKLIELFEQGE